MKPKCFLLAILMIIVAPVAAQTYKFDIASFIPPKGWQRVDSNGVLLLHDYRTQNNLTSFCQIMVFPSRASSNNPQNNFNDEWKARIAQPLNTSVKPMVTTEKTPDGWTVVSGMANLTQQGITYTCILSVISGFGKVMTIMVNLAGQDYVAEVEKFMNSFELDSKATAATGNDAKPSPGGAFNWSNYSFIMPDKWTVSKTNQYTLLSQSPAGEGCLITIFPPQPSSGNLETDARSLFNQMYPGWKFRNTGEKQYRILKGYTTQGLEYCMMEGDMHKMRPDGYYYDYEDGAVWVISMGKQVAIVTGRHNRLLSCYCHHYYENWRRFFNSFTVKNQLPPKNTEDASKRIIGGWMAIGGMALTEYIFAANGNYQFIGAYGTTSKVTEGYNDYLQIKTSAWKGDGTYSIRGNQIIFKKYGSQTADQVRFRFEKVNHGGTGWKDRLYMLQVSVADGKEFEVCYEKQSPR
ncbi:MAG TPA: hypothetical protein VD993_03925 [Chitinophagaceae bacterium]|nr:hypothetical protein [Chitinophagaceae bacterium]